MYDAIIVGARVAGAPVALLLARKGYRVLLVDRSTFPSDTLSTHYIHQPGVAALQRWGVLEAATAGSPAITNFTMDFGPLVLNGWGPACDGVQEGYAPRRSVLDTALVEAARAAGAEVREGFSIQELTFADGRVTGIRGRERGGTTVTEQGRIVIGADGLHSAVAKAVHAPAYQERPVQACYYYSYFSDFGLGTAIYPREGNVAVHFPTNDGLSVLAVGWKPAEFARVRQDIDRSFYAALERISPALSEAVQGASRAERWTGTADVPNFFRKPFGPGWALVGDAGYHKDPVTGYGITDAFRDAETLAAALDAGLSGREDLEQALAGYEQTRNAFAMPMYEFILQLAAQEAPPPEMQMLLGSLVGRPEEITRFCGLLDGTVSIPEYFAPDNLQRVIAGALTPAAD